MIDWVIIKFDSSLAAFVTTFFVEGTDEEVAIDEDKDEEEVKTVVGETVSTGSFVEFVFVKIFVGVTVIALVVVLSSVVSCCKK